jgi:hypothetical protein
MAMEEKTAPAETRVELVGGGSKWRYNGAHGSQDRENGRAGPAKV